MEQWGSKTYVLARANNGFVLTPDQIKYIYQAKGREYNEDDYYDERTGEWDPDDLKKRRHWSKRDKPVLIAAVLAHPSPKKSGWFERNRLGYQDSKLRVFKVWIPPGVAVEIKGRPHSEDFKFVPDYSANLTDGECREALFFLGLDDHSPYIRKLKNT